MYRSFGGDNHFLATRYIEQINCSLRSVSGWAYRNQKKHDLRGVMPSIMTRTPGPLDLQFFADFPVNEPWVTNLRSASETLHVISNQSVTTGRSRIVDSTGMWRGKHLVRSEADENLPGTLRSRLLSIRSVHASWASSLGSCWSMHSPLKLTRHALTSPIRWLWLISSSSPIRR